MAISELEKLAEDERPEFVRLFHTPPHERSQGDREKLKRLSSQISLEQYQFEVKRERAARPQRLTCTLISRDPYVIRNVYGEFQLPEELVPHELRESPEERYWENMFFAQVSADLYEKRITSFSFQSYLKRHTAEELLNILGTGDLLLDGDWPRR